MKIKNKVRLISTIALCVVLIGSFVGVLCYNNHLEQLQATALLEIEENRGEYNDNIIVLSSTNKRRAEKLATAFGATLRITNNGKFATLTLPDGVGVSDVYSDDANRKYLKDMSLDYRVSLAEEEEEILQAPNYDVSDSYYNLQTYLNYINIGNVWNNTLGQSKDGEKVTVAVIDTGIDTDHPEFFDADGNSIISAKSYNASSDKVVELYDISVIEDTQGHGTAVAGVIAAQMNGLGIVGIAPEIELIVIKCDTIDGREEFKSTSDIIFGIHYAIECDVDVINMSLGGGGNAFADALQLAVDSDIIPVAAAGNDSTDALHYPAADPNAIGVGALEADSFEIAGYSNFGPNSDIMAPGTTFTAALGGGYTYKNGTSFSSPIVTAAIALYISQNEYVNYEDVKAELLAAGKDLGNLGEDETYGFGCLDVSAFILEEKGYITYDYCTDDIESTKQVFVRQHTIQTVPEPERENIIFDDWYYDKAYTRVFDYDAWYTTDMVEDITLYAKWVNEDDEGASVYNYKTLADGTIEITSYKGKRRYLTIPDTIDDKVVSSIGERAFAGNTRLRGVTLPTGLVQIKDRAFLGVSKLREVTFTGEDLVSIGMEAFSVCVSLGEVKIPDTVVKIGREAFLACGSLSRIEITESSNLEIIGDLAFSNTAITSLYIPKNSNFDGGIVAYCDSLRSVTIHPDNEKYVVENSTVYNAEKTEIVYHPAALGGEYIVIDGISSINRYAFNESSITAIDIPEGVVFIGDNAFENTKLLSVVIPDSVSSLGEYAFAGSKITSVKLSENLSNISKYTFFSSDIESVHIPQNVSLILEAAFGFCGKLSSLTFSDNSKLHFIDNLAFASCTALENFTLPDRLEAIGESAFYGCSLISELIIPRGVRTIGGCAFRSCSSLRSVEFVEGCSVKVIPGMCFEYCTSLKSVKFSDGIVKIDMDAFNHCISLSELDFSEESHLITVGDGAFYACYSLKSMQLPGSVTSIGELAYAFSGLEGVEIGKNLKAIGKGAFGACFDLDAITVDEENTSFKSIDNVLFNYDVTAVYCVPASRIGSYTLPEGVRIVDSYSFYYCRELSEVILPSSLREINDSAFYYCSSLQGIEIPASVFNIGRQAFYFCVKLGSVSFAENSELERLGAYTFYRCGFDSFTVPASVTSMAQYVFYDCYKLTEITFEANSRLSYISAYMFRGCDGLKAVIFEDGSALTSIQAHAFDGAKNLEVIDFGDARIENIDNYAFYGNKKLAEFVLPTSVSYIGRYAFYGCEKFERVDLSILIEFIGENAFNNGLGNIRVFFALEELPEYAQVGWDNGIEGYFLNAKEYVEGDIWDYIITHSDTVSLVNYKGNNTVIIIDTLDGMTVEKLGAGVFRDNDAITSVILSNNVKEIGNYAFYGCDGIDYILVTPSVEVIGKYAFASSKISVDLAEADSLIVIKEGAFSGNITEKIILPDSVTTVGDYAFENSALSEIVISDGSALSKIGKGAFVGTTIEEIYLPESLTLVDDNAFKDITTLTRVTFAGGDIALKIGNSAFNNTGIVNVSIPKNVNYIGEYAFGANQCLQNIIVDKLNTSYTSLDGMLCDYYGTTLIQYPTGREGVVVIPKEITVLTYASFKDARKITEVSFEAGSAVKTIGWQTFSGCTTLTMITVPDSVVSFDFYAFENCTSLTDVIIGENSGLSGVYEGAFYGCTALSNINLPTSVVEISDYAFYNCKSLYFIPLGEGAELKLIGAYAFYGCENITSIPNYSKLLEIQDYAFGKTGVKEYTVPASLKEISIYAFVDSLLENIYAEEGNTEYVSMDGILFEKGASSVSDVDAIALWPFARVYILGDGKGTVTQADVVPIRNGVVKNYSWASSVKTIASYAFLDVYWLRGIIIPDSITAIEDYAFYGCGDLVIGFSGSTAPENLDRYWNYHSRTGEIIYHTDVDGFVVEEDATYAIKDGTAYFARYCSDAVSYDMKSEVNGYKVVAIGERSFYKATSLVNVTIGDNVKTIGNYAFSYCSSITSITIPENIIAIGDYAFSNCLMLSEIRFNAVAMNDLEDSNGILWMAGDDAEELNVIIGKNVTRIPAYLFCVSTHSSYQPKITSVVFEEDGVCNSIGKYAFNSCAYLKCIVVPESVSSIGDYAFSDCYNLFVGFEGKNLPDELGENWNHLSGYCADLKEFVVLDDEIYAITNDNEALLGKYYGDARSYNIKSEINGYEITAIAERAFYNTASLVNVTVSDTVKTIGRYAFSNCSSMRSIIIPADTTTIEDYAFNYCYGLIIGFVGSALPENCAEHWDGDWHTSPLPYYTDTEEFVLDEDATYVITKDGNAHFAKYYADAGSYNIKSEVNGFEVVDIEEKAFYNAESLVYVTIPDSVRSIGSYAFFNCVSLESIVIPEGVLSIGDGAYKNCDSLLSVSMPDSLETIGEYAFGSCYSLTSITIPRDVISIGNGAFSYCSAVEKINFNAVAMDDVEHNHCIFQDLQRASLTIGKNATRVPAYLFEHLNLTNVYFEDGSVCESIGKGSFAGCTVTNIEIPDKVTLIEELAFAGCASLKELTIGEGVVTIENDAFYDCRAIEKILYNAISANDLSVENGVFAGVGQNENNVKIVFGNQVTKVPAYLFCPYSMLNNLSSITCIEFEENSACESIGNYALSQCDKALIVFRDAELPGKFGYGWNGSAGYYTDFKELIFEDDATYVITNDDKAHLAKYYGDEASYTIKSEINGYQVVEVGMYAFLGCSSVETINIPDGVTVIGYGSFLNCTSLVRVNGGENLTVIESNAFGGCQILSNIIIYENVTSIGDYAFSECTNLKLVEIRSYEVISQINGAYSMGCVALYAETLLIPTEVEAVGYYVSNEFANVENVSCEHGDYISYSKHSHNWVFEEVITERLQCERDGVSSYVCEICQAKAWIIITKHTLTFFDGKEPTCTEIGWDAYEACSECDHITYNELPALGHYYNSELIAPTCTEQGYTTHKCRDCGDTYTDSYVDANGHSYVSVVTPPDCLNGGYTTHTCSVCGSISIDSRVEALGHSYGTVVISPTCTTTGYTIYTCYCGYTYVADNVAALGHSLVVDAGVEPTCTKNGLTDGTHCSVCGEIFVAQTVVDALGHDYSSLVTDPTCTTIGYTTYICSVCGDTCIADEIPSLGHNTGESLKENEIRETCTAEGSYDIVEYCTVCGVELSRETIVVDALGHIVGAEADCENDQICIVCGAVLANKLGHSYNAVVTAPTCTTEGYTTYTCHCGDTYVADEVAPLGHEYNSIVTTPTCTTEGYTTYTCHCGDTYRDDYVNATGHDYKVEVTAPTCTTAGYTAYTCQCGYFYVADEVLELGHTAGDVTVENEVAPSCTGNGSYDNVVYCTVCMAELSRETEAVGSLGHIPGAEADCENAQICTVCGNEVVAALGHSYNVVTIKPTCTTEGYTTYTCHCGDTYRDDYVYATGHDYNAVVTDPTCTTDGYTTYTCLTCGDTYIGAEVLAPGHKPNEAVKENEVLATCTAEGSYDMVSYCLVCNDEVWRVTEVINKSAHSYDSIDTMPTCTEVGYTTYVCHCGDTYIANEVPALGHDYISWPTAPTCTADGYTTYMCVRCVDTYIADEVPALGHDYISWPTAPTCTTGGYTTYMCMLCTDSYVADETPATGHRGTMTREENVVRESCTVDGSYDLVEYCTWCGTVISRTTHTTPALGHRYHPQITYPTCTDGGYTTYSCFACDDTYVSDEVPAKGHSVMVDAAVAPTCKESGLTEGRYCMECKEIFVVQTTIPATGHSYNAVVTDPTCTTAGYTTYTCTICEDAYVSDEVPATGHSYGAVTTAPTCTTEGYTTYTCHCGDSYVADRVTANGHIEVINTAIAPTCTATGLTEGRYCVVCNEVLVAQTEIAAKGHTLGETMEIVPPTYEASGVGRRDCDMCDYFEFCEIEPLGYLQVFIDTVADLSRGESAEATYSELYEALELYAKLTDEEKREAGDAFRTLQGAIEAYNAKAEIANGEMEKATEIAFLPIATSFTFLAALWFLLKKKFWIR